MTNVLTSLSTNIPSKGIQNERVFMFFRGPCASRAPCPQPTALLPLDSTPLLVPSTIGGTDAHEGAPGSSMTKLPPGPPPASTNNLHFVSPQTQKKDRQRKEVCIYLQSRPRPFCRDFWDLGYLTHDLDSRGHKSLALQLPGSNGGWARGDPEQDHWPGSEVVDRLKKRGTLCFQIDNLLTEQ